MLDSNWLGDTSSEVPIHASSALHPRLAIGRDRLPSESIDWGSAYTKVEVRWIRD